MTARHVTRGHDPLLTPRATQWQHERARGPILPMARTRRRFYDPATRTFDPFAREAIATILAAPAVMLIAALAMAVMP